MSGGLELSFVSEDQAWQMFDSMTASAVAMAGPIASFDQDVSEIIVEMAEEIKELIRKEFENKGWIPK